MVVSVLGIIHCVVESAAFFALYGHASNEIPNIYHVAKLANVARCLYAFEKFLCLFIQRSRRVHAR